MQVGFRANYSKETADCYFTEEIKSCADKGGVVAAAFLDLMVNHNVLFSKLSRFNVSVNVINVLVSYLAQWKQCTTTRDEASTLADCSIGVPQGSILGPIWFQSVYAVYLPSGCHNVTIQTCAANTVVLAHKDDLRACTHTHIGCCTTELCGFEGVQHWRSPYLAPSVYFPNTEKGFSPNPFYLRWWCCMSCGGFFGIANKGTYSNMKVVWPSSCTTLHWVQPSVLKPIASN